MFFCYDHLEFRYDPYPIGLAKPLMNDDIYQTLLTNWPAQEQFANIPKLGNKYSLSERFNPRQYRDLIRNQPVWRDLYRWIKSDAFIQNVLDTLKTHYIDLGYENAPPLKRLQQHFKDLRHGRFDLRAKHLRTRFEFSMLPANGGHILPHTDAPSKIVTLIVSIVDENEWNPAFGGGTDVNRPKDHQYSYNQLNRQAAFEAMDVLDTYEFTPNQAVIFIKTFNSWHSVRPMTGFDSPAMRKTLTINIETA